MGSLTHLAVLGNPITPGRSIGVARCTQTMPTTVYMSLFGTFEDQGFESRLLSRSRAEVRFHQAEVGGSQETQQ